MSKNRFSADLARLPTLPTVVLRLATLSVEQRDYFDQVLKLVRSDPGYTTRVLLLANAVGAGGARPVASTSMALIRIGARAAVDLMLAEAAVRIFPVEHVWQRELWAHSALAATFMRRLAPMVIDGYIDPEEAYLVGLLHDVGRFLIYGEAHDDPAAMERLGEIRHEELTAAEIELYGISHAELGELALRIWGLPEFIAKAAGAHHSTSDTDPIAVTPDALVTLLRDVDWLALLIAREGTAWLEQPEDAIATAFEGHMQSRYRGDIQHRLGTLRGAASEAMTMLAALQIELPGPGAAGSAN